MMGQGISLYNSIGHDEDTYTAGAGMGDSLLWRFIRYAAKDWERPLSTRGSVVKARGSAGVGSGPGSLAVTFADPDRNDVTVSDISGRRVFARTYTGESGAEIPGLQRGIYYVRVASKASQEVKQVRIL
jgi:hypothetical protein